MSRLVIGPSSVLKARTMVPPRVPVAEHDVVMVHARAAEGLARENDERHPSFRLSTIRRRVLLSDVRV